jgi:hypothetical protein
MNSLNRDVIRQIALNLNIEDIYSLCLTSTLFNKNICNEDNFWYERIRLEFPCILNNTCDKQKPINATWKRYYQLLNPSRTIRVNYVIDARIDSKWVGRDRITGEDFYMEETFEIPRIVKDCALCGPDTENYVKDSTSVKDVKRIVFKFPSHHELLEFEKLSLNFRKYLVFIEEYPETVCLIVTGGDGKIRWGEYSNISNFLKGKEISFMFHEEYNKVFKSSENIYHELDWFIERKLRNGKGYVIVDGKRLSIVGIKLPDNFSDLQ